MSIARTSAFAAYTIDAPNIERLGACAVRGLGISCKIVRDFDSGKTPKPSFVENTQSFTWNREWSGRRDSAVPVWNIDIQVTGIPTISVANYGVTSTLFISAIGTPTFTLVRQCRWHIRPFLPTLTVLVSSQRNNILAVYDFSRNVANIRIAVFPHRGTEADTCENTDTLTTLSGGNVSNPSWKAKKRHRTGNSISPILFPARTQQPNHPIQHRRLPNRDHLHQNTQNKISFYA
jgi:hypothetical protein